MSAFYRVYLSPNEPQKGHLINERPVFEAAVQTITDATSKPPFLEELGVEILKLLALAPTEV
jgi:hypothetical protein